MIRIILLAIIVILGPAAISAHSETAESDQKAIYGIDNRLDEFQVSITRDLSLGASTVILVNRIDITDNSLADPNDRTFTLANTLFGNSIRAGESQACISEPFRNQENPGFCSGFLVGPDIVVTAGHCVLPDPSCVRCDASGFQDIFVVAGFAVTSAATPDDPELTIPATSVYTIQQVLQKTCNCTSDEDWAVIRLDRQATFAPLGIRRSGEVADNEDLFIIGYPAGLPRKYAAGAAVLENDDTIFFETNLDTYGGNSGSAVFNENTGEVEGILVRGDTDYCADTTNNCWYSCTYLQNPSNCAGNNCEEVTRIHLNGLLPHVPRVVFVDRDYTGGEIGEKRAPFNTILEGKNSLASGGGSALVIQPGNYLEAPIISTPMTIYNGEYKTGIVRIGQ